MGMLATKFRYALLGAATTLLMAAQQPLEREPAEDVLDAAIRVRVVDESGRAVPGARIVLRPIQRGQVEAETGDQRLGQDWRNTGITTDGHGMARLDGIRPGPWRVGAASPPVHGYGFAPIAEAGTSVTVVLPRLPKENVLAGVVLQPDGSPFEHAQVVFVWDERGRRRHIRKLTGGDGGFMIVTEKPHVTGALHASGLNYTFRSTAVESITTGVADIVLRMGEQRLMTIEGTDQNGEVFPVHGKILWQLAGHPYEDSRYSKAKPGETAYYAHPVVPFFIDLWPRDKFAEDRIGPFDPETIESKIEFDVQTYARLGGRVMQGAMPVPYAWVSLTPILSEPPTAGQASVETHLALEMNPPHARAGNLTATTATDVDGYFDLPLRAAGKYQIKATHGKIGNGLLESIELDPRHPPDDLEIELQPLLTETGTVSGRVLLPPGKDYSNVWLATVPQSRSTSLCAYMPLAADGSYRLNDVPAGPVTIRFREGFGSPGEWQRKPGQWVQMSHGPQHAPAWMVPEPTFDLVVEDGKTVEFDIDLTEPAKCRLEGKIQLNGVAPTPEPKEPAMYDGYTPRVILDRMGYDSYVSRCELGEDGTFVLQAHEPGTYRLRIEVPTEGERDWHLFDSIDMQPGTQTWEHNFPTGGLRLLPRADQSVSLQEEVRWAGPGGLRVFQRRWSSDAEDAEEVFFPVLPAGKIQVFDDEPERRVTLHEVEIVAGEITEVRRP